jgi:hypothetical protein
MIYRKPYMASSICLRATIFQNPKRLCGHTVVWTSHGEHYEEYSLLKRHAMSSGTSWPTFWISIIFSSPPENLQNIVTSRSDSRRFFLLDIWFIYHLYTRLDTTSNYSAIAKLHNSQITTVAAKFFQIAVFSPALPWKRLLTVGILNFHAIKSSPNGDSLPIASFSHRLLYRIDSAQVILESESCGTRDHILPSQFRDFPFRRLLRLAGLRWRYSAPPPHGCPRCLPYNPLARTE